VGGDLRTICGKGENGTTGVPHSGSACIGAIDAKVPSSAMARSQQVWARWGRPDGSALDAGLFLQNNPTWPTIHGALATFYLQTYAAQTPNGWAVLGDRR